MNFLFYKVGSNRRVDTPTSHFRTLRSTYTWDRRKRCTCPNTGEVMNGGGVTDSLEPKADTVAQMRFVERTVGIVA